MAKQSPAGSAGGKWTLPNPASCGPLPTLSPKSGKGSGVAAANKHATTSPGDMSLASSLSAKNKHHG